MRTEPLLHPHAPVVQPAEVIAGEVRAIEVVGQIQAGVAHPDALGNALLGLSSPGLLGFARRIQKTLERCHG